VEQPQRVVRAAPIFPELRSARVLVPLGPKRDGGLDSRNEQGCRRGSYTRDGDAAEAAFENLIGMRVQSPEQPNIPFQVGLIRQLDGSDCCVRANIDVIDAERNTSAASERYDKRPR
jgi:hypothetical protein